MKKQNQFKNPSLLSTTSTSTISTNSRQRKLSSSSDQSSICSTKALSKPETQLQLDLKYNEYLRATLTHKLMKKKMNENKDLLDRQTIQLARMTKELTDLKCEHEIQNESNSYSKTLREKMNENSQLTNKLLDDLQKNCTTHKEMLTYFKIMSSQMPVYNVDLTGCDNELFYKSLENMNEQLKSISDSFVTRQNVHLKDIFEKIEVKNDQLCKMYKECLQQINSAASNVIINTTNQLNTELTDETEQ